MLEEGLEPMDIVLCYLAEVGSSGKPNEPIETYTRLSRIVFLLSLHSNFKNILHFPFEETAYGPISIELYDHLIALEIAGYVKEEILKKDPVSIWEVIDEKHFDEECLNKVDWKYYVIKQYSLTEKGLKVALELYTKLTKAQRYDLKQVKKFWNNVEAEKINEYYQICKE